MKYERVYACQDEAGHWYVIPHELKERFHKLLDDGLEDDYEAQEKFTEEFSQYRTGGDLNNVDLFKESK